MQEMKKTHVGACEPARETPEARGDASEQFTVERKQRLSADEVEIMHLALCLFGVQNSQLAEKYVGERHVAALKDVGTSIRLARLIEGAAYVEVGK